MISGNLFSIWLQLWDVRRKGCIFTYKGHSEVINSIQFSPDGKWVVSASSDSTVKVQDGACVIRLLMCFFSRRATYLLNMSVKLFLSGFWQSS